MAVVIINSHLCVYCLPAENMDPAGLCCLLKNVQVESLTALYAKSFPGYFSAEERVGRYKICQFFSVFKRSGEKISDR